MAHEITLRSDGFAEAAFSEQPAWHGLGQVFDHPMACQEAFRGAGLDWTIEQDTPLRRQFTFGEDGKLVFSATETIQVPDHRLNIRSDTGEVLGLVTDHYKVVQNVEAFEFLDALVENHEMQYESAFSLFGGRKVVVVARMPGYTEIVPGDAQLPYIMLSLSHDGKEAIRFGPTSVRVVCANTYALANEGREISNLTIRHTGDIKSKLAKARSILSIASTKFAQYAEIGQQLAKRKLSKDEWFEYLDIMCPELDPRDPDYTPRRARALQETRDEITRCFCNAKQGIPGIVQSAWAAFNAVTEHIDHLPRRGANKTQKAEARFNVCLYGIGRDMKERAFQTACRFAEIESSL